MQASSSIEPIDTPEELPPVEPAIRLEGVNKSFQDKLAVVDLDLEVTAGSIFGLIGPNGAGKTTTLKMVATLIKPDAGRITVCGRDLVSKARVVRPLIGYMPDAFGLFRGLSCLEYLQYFGRTYNLGGEDLKNRIEAVFELTDLDTVRDELTTALSTGMKQRLSLAKTLLHDPEVLILDEPASGLDPRARIEIRSLLRELRRMGKTIIISSHILTDLEETCSHVAIIEQGRVVWSGPLQEARAAEDPRLRVVLVVPSAAAAGAVKTIEALSFVAKVVHSGDGRLEVELEDGRGNELLREVIASGVEVVSFTRERRDLESLFLEQTKGIVS